MGWRSELERSASRPRWSAVVMKMLTQVRAQYFHAMRQLMIGIRRERQGGPRERADAWEITARAMIDILAGPRPIEASIKLQRLKRLTEARKT